MNTNVLLGADAIRIRANAALDRSRRGTLGQFFTPSPIGLYMASLFDQFGREVYVLDPGCGPGILTAALIDELLMRETTDSVKVEAFDIEPAIRPFIDETLAMCEEAAKAAGISCHAEFILGDFILSMANQSGLLSEPKFTHVIMNPPYKKISTTSEHRKALRAAGIETVNLYTGFVGLAIQQLLPGGELVAIIPRSFCNGPYYRPFRELLLRETAIRHIHIFESRTKAFAEDEVLQENIIIHVIKGRRQDEVTITSSPCADFHVDDATGTICASDMTTRTVSFDAIVKLEDRDRFIHIAANNSDQAIIDRLSVFTSRLEQLEIEVSTGPVVDFRLRDDLRVSMEDGAVPLLYPVHLDWPINWPAESRKPNAIMVSRDSRSWLWRNEGWFVLLRRFSSKEERRRIVATPYDGGLPGELIGFENKLNVFHSHKRGVDRELALGLYAYLNCTLLDKYYRLFGGHTQVNATDLRNIHYPSVASLRRIGSKISRPVLSQRQIDALIDEEIDRMAESATSNPLASQQKIDDALNILQIVGMPKSQQNDRSALTLLALLNLHPEGSWDKLESPMIGVTPIMDWCRDVYGREYAPNTRETFRRQTLHQFVEGGLCLYNPDEPNRPVNSPKACYQIAPDLLRVLRTYGSSKWDEQLVEWLKGRVTLTAQYAKARDMEMIPLRIEETTEIRLSPGAHSELIRDVVEEFGPRFVPGAEVIYLGDTGAKEDFFKRERLKELGVVVDRKGKLPDVVLYWPKKNWLVLVESVTSHGPVDGKRHAELGHLFRTAKPGLVYVTAFPDRRTMTKYLSDISWETEVWVADAPTHLIHFNGDRFLGPY